MHGYDANGSPSPTHVDGPDILAPGPANTDLVTQYQTEAAWVESRQRFIGASELAGILGLSDYASQSPMAIWQRKCMPETVEPLEGEFLDWGHRLERPIMERWMDDHRDLVLWPNDPFDDGVVRTTAHPEFPIIRGTEDALLTRGGVRVAGLDAKNMGAHRAKDFGEPGTDEMPDAYVIQGLIYCEIFDVAEWHFAVLFGGQKFASYTVARDSQVADRMITRALGWWEEHVTAKRCPEIDGSESSTAVLAAMYPREERPMVTDAATVETARTLALAKLEAEDRVKVAKGDEAAAKNALREIMGHAEGVKGVCTWRANRDTVKVDWRAVAESLGARLPAEYKAAVAMNSENKPGSRVLRISRKEVQA